MSLPPDCDSLILELEARQDDALRQLVELDQRIEAVLRAALPTVGPGSLGQAALAEPAPPLTTSRAA